MKQDYQAAPRPLFGKETEEKETYYGTHEDRQVRSDVFGKPICTAHLAKCSVNLKSLTELGQTTKVSISDLGCSPVKRCNEFPKK